MTTTMMTMKMILSHARNDKSENKSDSKRRRRRQHSASTTTTSGVLLASFVVALLLSITTTTAAAAAAAVDNNKFPGIYTLHCSKQEWIEQQQQPLHPSAASWKPAWLHMDVLQVQCDIENNSNNNDNNNNDRCYIQTLIQTPQEYQTLQDNQAFPFWKQQPPPLIFNDTLTTEWVEPRLQIVQEHLKRRRQEQENQNSRSSSNDDDDDDQHQRTNRNLQEDQEEETTTTYSTIAMRDCYLDYAGMMDWMDDFVLEAQDYLQVSLVDIGDSYLKTMNENKGGNDIHVLTVTGKETNTATAAPLILMTSIHAREYAPPELVRRFLLDLLEQVKNHDNGNNVNDNVSTMSWLQHTQIHWIPYANVDGRIVAETTQPWRRKNMNGNWNDDSDACSSDAWGVDLNRNYPFAFGRSDGSSVQACSPFARGDEPQSEPETQAVMEYADQILDASSPLYQQQRQEALPIQTTSEHAQEAVPEDWQGYNESSTRGVFVDLHSYGEGTCQCCCFAVHCWTLAPYGVARSSRFESFFFLHFCVIFSPSSPIRHLSLHFSVGSQERRNTQ